MLLYKETKHHTLGEALCIKRREYVRVQGVGFNVADGRTMCIWIDRWPENVKLLDVYTKDMENEHLQKKVVDYWLRDAQNWATF